MPTPPRLGIVDIGSNAIRFLVAEVATAGPNMLESHRLPVRLGNDVFQTGRIPDATIAAVVDAFRRFRASCDRFGVNHVRAIATSAMREAHNRQLLIDRVREACGIEIEVISGTQEAYLLKLGVATKIDLSRGCSLLVDVGGGSVEVVLVEDGSVLSADSYRLGALRMLALVDERETAGEALLEIIHRHLRGLERRISDRFEGRRIDRYAAVGGNIDSLADLCARRGSVAMADGVERLPIAAVSALISELAQLTVAERMARFDLRPDRADTIMPAGIVYTQLGELAGVDGVLVPRTGIKDGLLAELAQGHFADFAAADHVDVALAACRALGRRFHYEADHAEQVLRLARSLFDQTRDLHGLDARARVLLDAAALLHDIGVAVNNDGHHKHSQYLIQASDLVGLTDEERALVALVARYHRKAGPNREHPEFAALRRRERSIVERLAAFLRLADALDRQHAGVVSDITVEAHADRIDLRPTLGSDPSSHLVLERKAVAEKGALFTALFGKPIALLSP